MSARRTNLLVEFAGVDISDDVSQYLKSFSYTDNEMGEADDLQISLDDRDGVWLDKWLNVVVQAAAAPAVSPGWAVGDDVIASGKPQYSSSGFGKPGQEVAGHAGKVTFLNLTDGIPYPIHVDQLGWFAESQVQKSGGEAAAGGEETGIKGLKIKASILREHWGDGSDVLDCGEFELDCVEASGPESSVVIKGTSLPYRSPVRQTQKSKAWDGYTLAGIAKEIAGKNNMGCMFESTVDPAIAHAEQVKKSDVAFLQSLCNKYGLSLKATANMLVIFSQAEYEGKPPVRSFAKGDGTHRTYRLRTGESDTQYGACHVIYTDPATKQVIEYTHYLDPTKKKDIQTLEICRKVASVGEAMELAKQMLRLKNKFEYTADLSMPGDPVMVAGVTVQLVDYGMFTGKYIVQQAKHTVSGAGYTVDVRLRRTLEGY